MLDFVLLLVWPVRWFSLDWKMWRETKAISNPASHWWLNHWLSRVAKILDFGTAPSGIFKVRAVGRFDGQLGLDAAHHTHPC